MPLLVGVTRAPQRERKPMPALFCITGVFGGTYLIEGVLFGVLMGMVKDSAVGCRDARGKAALA